MAEEINSFKKEYYFLSNMYSCKVEFGDFVFNSSEAAYQAQKSTTQAEMFTKLSGRDSKILGRKMLLPDNWEETKYEKMERIVKAKFTQNSDLREKLLATGDAKLIEGNYWHDNYWGDCNCTKCKDIVGKNCLGEILMKIRDELKEN